MRISLGSKITTGACHKIMSINAFTILPLQSPLGAVTLEIQGFIGSFAVRLIVRTRSRRRIDAR